MTELVGTHDLNVAPRLRWIWYGGSICSERGNPLVTTHRQVIRALVERGQEVEYLEPANHRAFVDALREEGSAFYRSFLVEYPDIRYRRYDMPRAHERDVWMSREAALADVIVIESGAPAEVFKWIARVEERSFIRLLIADSGSADGADFDFVLAPDSEVCRYEATTSPGEVTEQVNRLLNLISVERARKIEEKLRA